MNRRAFLRTAGTALLAAPAVLGAGERRRPNLLFAVADDWGFGHAGAYGCPWVKTPNFDRVAREGLLFTHAYTPCAKCSPSRAALLTGRNPWQLKAAANHWPFFPPEFGSYPEALTAAGWHVGKTGKGWGPGTAETADGRPRQLAGKPFERRKAPPPTSAMSNNDYAANFADFLDASAKDTPFCFWYGGYEPHRPYEFGSGVAKGGKRLTDIDRVPGCWPDTPEVRHDMLDYAFEVEHFDRHLGRMLDELARRGLLDDTLVVVTGDNGMPFPHDKGQTYQDANHLPLALRWPHGVRASGRVVDDYVSFIDLAPTFLDVAGLPWPASGLAPATGRSLTDILYADAAGRVNPARDHVLLGRERNDVGRPHDWGYPVRGVVRDDWLYLHNYEPSRWPNCNPETGYKDTDSSPTKTAVLKTRLLPEQQHFWDTTFGKRGPDELYDLRVDRDCLHNLAAAQPERVRQLRELLQAELVAQGDPRALGNGAIFDTYPVANPAARGFYERFKAGQAGKEGWEASDFESAPLE